MAGLADLENTERVPSPVAELLIQIGFAKADLDQLGWLENEVPVARVTTSSGHRRC